MWSEGIYEGPHSFPQNFFAEFWGNGVGCLVLALTYAFKDFCQLTRSLVSTQKCTLITSLSEFISVFKQPTSSVAFRRFKYHHLKVTL